VEAPEHFEQFEIELEEANANLKQARELAKTKT